MNFIENDLEQYVIKHTSSELELLAKLRRVTHQKSTHPQMLSGIYQGRLLSVLSKIINPSNILEVGTFTGYATLCLAEGLQKNGKITTIDVNDEVVEIAKEFFESSVYKNQIELKIGSALDIIPNLNNTFDLVFLDADKSNYIKYYDLILDKLRPNGVILADNVLWYGKVLSKTDDTDLDTKILQEFNKKVTNDSRVDVVILPIRDGISIIRKK